MTQVKLLNGPCDPRLVDMVITWDADLIAIRPMPFGVHDIYKVVDRFEDRGETPYATAEYQYTDGGRPDVEKYRAAVLKFGAGRAFRVKRQKKAEIVH